jgi:hypothetical protein
VRRQNLLHVIETLLEVLLSLLRDIGVVESSLEAGGTEVGQHEAFLYISLHLTYTLVGSLPSSA